ncbi:MAG: hypothetical protein ABI041_02550, partial [Bdellovibrionia bacterium]
MFEKFIASILLVSLVTTNASFAMDPPLDCGDGGYRGTYLNFDGCDGGGFGGFEDAGTSSGFGNGSSVGGEYEATLGLDSSDSSSFAGGNHTWYTDPKAPPDGPPALLKYYALIKPTTPIELERYYALNRFYPNMGTKDEFRQRTKAYKEYNDWIPLERARAKLEAYKAEDVKRVEDAIALEKKQAEENRIRNEQLEAEMAPIRRQYQED